MNENDKSLEIKKIRCIDGLYYSFEILEHFYKDLHYICCSLIKSKENVSKALTHSWGFIDTVHRIREISKSTPGINQKSPEMRKFLDTTKVTQVFRNYIQHLNNELKKNSPKNMGRNRSLIFLKS